MPTENPDLVGERFGRLTVTAQAERRAGRGGLYWTCACECGRPVVVSTSHLQSGHTRSCGWHGAGSPQQAGITSLIHRFKTSARSRGFAFELTREQFISITSSPCHYCGIEPSTVRHGDLRCSPGTIERSGYLHNGIDRVDSARGYVIDNVVPCCKFCNTAKWMMTVDEFKAWVARVYRHMKLG